jgi:hypothetical protein
MASKDGLSSKILCPVVVKLFRLNALVVRYHSVFIPAAANLGMFYHSPRRDIFIAKKIVLDI